MPHDPQALLESAIRDLGAWKMHLETAVDTGFCAMTAAQARETQTCALGHWLAQAAAPGYEAQGLQTLRRLHAAFHALAGDILRYVELGELEEANVLYETDLLELSAALVLDLRRWAFSYRVKSA